MRKQLYTFIILLVDYYITDDADEDYKVDGEAASSAAVEASDDDMDDDEADDAVTTMTSSKSRVKFRYEYQCR